MKILVIGGTGMLGHKLVQRLGQKHSMFATVRTGAEILTNLAPSDHPVTVIENIDSADRDSLNNVLKDCSPDVVINAVGVIKQRSESVDVINTLNVNSIFPHQLYSLCREVDARMITISTDCVFSGKRGNYSESDVPDALDLYGTSKRLGEIDAQGALTIRTSIIGRELHGAHGLLEWFLSNRGGSIKGFSKAVFSGFPTIVLADIIGRIIEEFPDLEGLYHVSAEPINKYDLTVLFDQAFNTNITIDRDEAFVIDRSLDSMRFRAATGFVPPSWPDMISALAEDQTPYETIRNFSVGH